jgi:hypothetical protein
MKLDNNRLLMVIKDRHVLVERLEMALKESKKDGMGDMFRINAILKHQREQLSVLEKQLKDNTVSPETLKAMKLQDKKRDDEAAVARLRHEIDQWIRHEL